jgi:hypothetical protein
LAKTPLKSVKQQIDRQKEDTAHTAMITYLDTQRPINPNSNVGQTQRMMVRLPTRFPTMTAAI